MSLKAELTTWSLALKSYEDKKYENSIEEFTKIADTSKIYWNIGIILATLGKHDKAIKQFNKAVELDTYFAVGYHQAGVSNFVIGNYKAALKDFEDALLYLRGNQTINYEQLGLDFRLYSCEVLFNCGLTKIYLGQLQEGLSDLKEAKSQKVTKEHDVIDDAIRDNGRDYNVFSVPVGVLFKPSPKKLKNLASRDYMGKAILVAATDANDAYTTFTGITRLQRGQTPTGAPLDSSHPSLSRSASVSAIPQIGGGNIPTLNRMSRSNTVGITDLNSTSRSSNSGLNRSLTTSINRPVVEISTDIINFDNKSSLQPMSAPVKENSIPNIRKPFSATEGFSSTSSKISTGQSSNLNREPSPSPYIKTPLNRFETKSILEDTSNGTEIIDDYYQSYGEEYENENDDFPKDLPPINGIKWNLNPSRSNSTTTTITPNMSISRQPSILNTTNNNNGRNQSLSSLYDGISTTNKNRPLSPPSYPDRLNISPGGVSGAAGGGLNLNLTRTISAATTSNRGSNYENGSENGQFYDMVKVRVKVNYGSHKRGMSILPTHTYTHFINSLLDKFPELRSKEDSNEINVTFKDEDGDILSMRDEGDFEAAIDVARILGESGGRNEGRLEIWVN